MGSEFVQFQQDPWAGHFATGLATALSNAPGKALQQTQTVEEILKAREERARATEKWNAAQESIKAFPDTLQKTVAPDSKLVPGPWNPDAPNTIMPAPDAETGLPAQAQDVIDPRKQAQLDAYNKMAIAAFKQKALAGSSEAFGPMIASAIVGGGGVPANMDERQRAYFLANHKYMTDAEKSTATPHTFAVQGPDGEITGQKVTTNNNKTELGTNKPLFGAGGIVPQGHSLVLASPANANQSLDEGIAKQKLAVLARQSAGRDLTPAETQNVKIYAATAYPASRVREENAGVFEEKYVHDKEMPGHVVDLLGRSGLLSGAAPAPGAVTTPVNPNASRVTATMASDPLELSDRVMRSQEVKDYLSAITSYNSLIESTAIPINNTTDLQIVYAIAKLFDPGSVVRDSEIKLSQGAGTMAQQMAALYSRLYNDKGMMSAETRANLIEQGYVRMKEYANNKDVVVNHYRDTVAPSRKVDPALAVPKMPEMKPFDKAAVLKMGQTADPAPGGTGPRGARPAPTSEPAVSTPPPPPVIQRGNAAFGVP